MNVNRQMEMYYYPPNANVNANANANGHQPHNQFAARGAYPYHHLYLNHNHNQNQQNGNEGGVYMGFFEGLPVASPPFPYLYPPQETRYWAYNMNSYYQHHQQQQQRAIPYSEEEQEQEQEETSSYYQQVNPRAEVHRRTWEYSPSLLLHHPHHPSPPPPPPDSPTETSTDTPPPEDAWQDDIDPDNMTYEELLDLGEAVGTESRGLSQDLIKLLPTSRYKAGGFFSRKKSRERCVICLVTYKIGDQQITLPCKHVYHAKCGRKWLSINKTCPVCNSEVFGDEARN